jgi:hypothetical protein
MDPVMHLHLHRPAAPHRAAADGPEAERSLAEAWLGSGHPLVRSLGRSKTAREQLASVTGAGAAGVVWYAGGWPFGLSLALAAGAAQVVFACRIALLRSGRRGLCLELIAHGGAGLPLPCIQRRCRDLLDRRALERLADSIDELVRAAVHPEPVPVFAHSLSDRRVIRAVAADLREVAALLRGRPAVQGVALVEWLLTSAATPLYGTEAEPLRQELARARYLLVPH